MSRPLIHALIPLAALAAVAGASGCAPAASPLHMAAVADAGRVLQSDGGGTPAAPPRAAELFGAGVFSTGLYELPPSFTPDGRTAYFTVSTPAYGRLHVIMETHLRNGRWTAPEVAPFSGRYGDADPVLSADGNRLFFISKRPVTPGGEPRRDFDIWVTERQGAGWGEPRHIPEASGPGAEHYVTEATDGTLYIAAVRPDSRGRGDIYRVPVVNGRYGAPENLGPAVNSPDHHDTTPFVAPDQSYLIFGSSGRPDGLGGIDLYISHRQPDGAWSPARNLGPAVNSIATEYCPVVAVHDGHLYFASDRGFTDEPLPHAISAAEWTRRLGSPGNSLGDTYRIELARAVAAAGGRP